MVKLFLFAEAKHRPQFHKVIFVYIPALMPTFYDRFVECAQRWPQNVAVEVQRPDGIESYSYAELRRMAESIAAWLLDSEMAAGTRVAILADNHPRWVAAYLGIIAAGGTTVPLDTAYHADQVAKLLRDSGATLLICDQKHLETAQEAVAGSDTAIVLTGTDKQSGTALPAKVVADFDGIFAQYTERLRPVPRAPSDVASLLYTSGTTADPKGVMLAHSNLLAEADAVFGWAHIGPDDAILGVLPLFHVLSQMANLLLPLVAGTRVVYLSTLNTTELLRALRERNVTAFAVVPQFFNLIHERIFKEVQQRGAMARFAFARMMLLNGFCRKFGFNLGRVLFGKIHDLFGRRMRYLVTGGSRFDPQIGQDFYALGIDVLQAYGLTETCGGAFVNSLGQNVVGSAGKPLKGVEGKIINAQTSDDDSPASGEILIRGPIVMKGYWNRPDATAEVLKDGWLHTGDLGYFDDHRNLFITGRQKDVIILPNGKNVYPEEIEAHYLQSPLIKEICVLGLEDGGTEKLYAVITPNFEVLRQRKIVNTKEVIRFDVEGLSAKLPSTKRIAGYEIWQEDLPRTTTRKLKRFEIEKRVKAGKRDDDSAEITRPITPEDSAWLEQPDNQRALKIIREYSPSHPENILPTNNLELDLGLDSMRRVELLVALEQELGGDVEESRLSDIYTVREIVDAIRESAASGTISNKKPAQTFAGWGKVLTEDPSDPAALSVTEPRPFTNRMLFVVTRVIKLLWSIRAPVKVEGLENIPSRAPFLLCSNHQSFLDPVMLLAILPLRVLTRLFAVGTSEIFGSGLMRRVARILRVVVVDPDANLIPAMRAGAYGLRQGLSLILYPEGERSIDGTPRIFKKGAAILSIHLQVPIVPIAIDGFYDAWPRGKGFQNFAPLRIKIGKPIIPPLESQASEEAYAKLTAELKERIVKMWEEIRNRKVAKASA